MSQSTVKALMARGINSDLADRLAAQGFTLTRLKQLARNSLRQLGLTEDQTSLILDESRPPIPIPILDRLLYASRRACCICRNSAAPVVIHHIIEWSVSRSHDEDNLVVLCLAHHDEAHTTRQLSQNLTVDRIRSAKEEWQNAVRTMDARTILGLFNNDQSYWAYINYRRVFEKVLELNLSLTDIRHYQHLRSLRILDQNGVLTDPATWLVSGRPTRYLTELSEGIYINFFMTSVLQRLFARLPIVDVTNRLNRGELRSLLRPGTYLAVQHGFYFQEQIDEQQEPMKRAYCMRNGTRIEFVYNPWNCTSDSARNDAMLGHRIITAICRVRSILPEEATLVINTSCLAVGSGFDNHASRQV